MNATQINEQIWQLVDNYTLDGCLPDMQLADLLEYIISEAEKRMDDVQTRLHDPESII